VTLTTLTPKRRDEPQAEPVHVPGHRHDDGQHHEETRGAGDEGEVLETQQEIELAVERGDVLIAVSDRDPGIPESHREQVFERFFSYRPGNGSDRHEHAGLGLSIARAIVDAYGGRIVARPRENGGAIVEVRLPRTRSSLST
jgi:signal transduction histidine kinase